MRTFTYPEPRRIPAARSRQSQRTSIPMTQTDKLTFVREKCIAANPEITKRRFYEGSGIRLADVLLAIEEGRADIEMSLFGDLFHIGHYEKPGKEGYYSKCYWK